MDTLSIEILALLVSILTLILIIIFQVFTRIPVNCICSTKGIQSKKICPVCDGETEIIEGKHDEDGEWYGISVKCTYCNGKGYVCSICNGTKKISLLDRIWLYLFKSQTM